MKVAVVESFNTAKGIITAGQIIDIPGNLYDRLKGKVKLVPENEGRDLPHYCPLSECWCSEKLPDRNYPAGCISSNCEYYQPKEISK
jgi:hypothetical protein